jgi:hypothetical protein
MKKLVELNAGNAKRVLSMLVALAKEHGEARVRCVEGSHDSICVEVYTRPTDFSHGNLVDSASVWIAGPYADEGACFASGPAIRGVVGRYYPEHREEKGR